MKNTANLSIKPGASSIGRCLAYTMLLALFLSTSAQAQITSQDADGQSSILYQGSNINFDLGKAALSATWNNYRKSALDSPHILIWGLSASSKNKDGLSELFNQGKLTTLSRLDGFIGLRINGTKQELALNNRITALYRSAAIRDYIAALNYPTALPGWVNTSDAADRVELRDTLKAMMKHSAGFDKDLASLTELEARFKTAGRPAAAAAIQVVADSLTARQKKIAALQTDFLAAQHQIVSLNAELTEYRSNHVSHSWTIYLNGGWNANKFNFYSGDTTRPSLSARFDTVKFWGGFIDLGVNYDFGAHWTFGASIGYERYNNLDSFSTNDFDLETVSTVNNQELIQDTKYSAYTGHYVAYNRYNLKTDALYFGKVNDDYRYVWNVLYTRLIAPFGTSAIRSIWNAGSCITFYKSSGKFSGGIYVQSTDVFDHMGAGNSFGSRLSFGVVAKYSFQSIVDRLK